MTTAFEDKEAERAREVVFTVNRHELLRIIKILSSVPYGSMNGTSAYTIETTDDLIRHLDGVKTSLMWLAGEMAAKDAELDELRGLIAGGRRLFKALLPQPPAEGTHE